MRFSTIAITTASLAAVAQANSVQVGFQIRRSGSPYHLSSVGIVGSDLAPADTVITGSVQDDTTFKLDDGQFITVASDGSLGVGATGATGFAFSGGYLSYKGSSGINVCPDSANKNLSVGECANAAPVSVVPLDTAGQTAPDFPVAASDISSSAPSVTSVIEQSTTIATITSCGPEVTNCPVATPSVSSYAGNAAALNGGFAAAAAVAFALL